MDEEDELDRWLYLDGPEPEPVRTLLDALRELPPATAEDKARRARSLFQRLDALRGAGEDPRPEEGTAAPVGQDADASPLAPAPCVRPLKLAPPDPEDVAPPTVAQTPAPVAPVAAPSTLAGTSLELNLKPLSARIGLPFKDPKDLAPTARATRTQPSPAYRDPTLGETLPLGDDSIARAMAAVPFVASAPGAAPTLGGLTLPQYTSFRAELTVWPEWEETLLVRYQVWTREGRAVLDELWQQHLARNPQTRAAFEEKLAEFTAHLRVRREWDERR